MSDATSSTNTASQAASSSAGGVLATLPEPGTLVPQQFSPPTFGPAGGDAAAGGLDLVRVMHAIRRCWLPATAVGIGLATAATALAWFLLPRNYEAVAWLRVRTNPGSFAANFAPMEYDQYRKTQLQLIKSPFVLNAALRRPGISNLESLRDEKDQVAWLNRYIEVSAPAESEVVLIRMRGENPREIQQLVNAVTQSYLTDVVNKERTERLARRDMLEKKYKENMAEVRTRLETFNNLARSLGHRDSAEVATQRSLLLDHLGTLRAQLTQLQRDVVQIDTELALIDASEKNGEGEGEAVDGNLMRHPQMAELSRRLAELEEVITYQSERSARGTNDPAVRRLIGQREDLLQRIESRAAELRPQVLSEMARPGAGSGAVASSPAVLRMRRDILAKQLEDVSKEFDEVAKEVTALGNANADLEARRNEIQQLQTVTNQMGIQLNASEVDIAMPNRVELIEEASLPGQGDILFRLLLTALAGLGGFAAGFGGVVMLEYLRARLATVEDATQRVGIRVIGTVPAISRSAKRSNAEAVSESIDGVRTIIAQTGREAPKVILVTSAVEHEGKTTFAAQLAASLARAGHRTLLLDGDLRHPNVHLALELDLRAGLPELLRGEITNDEAVQPTSIDGLFAVTGGACDYASITALSRADTARIIKGFRGSFDHVVIDAGPVLAFADALLLGQQSDAAIVVTMRDVSRVPLVTKAVERLRSVGIRVLGTVINGVTDDGPRRRYASPVSA